jgi:hypothetical protein
VTEETGTLADEAAKLFAAVQEWTRNANRAPDPDAAARRVSDADWDDNAHGHDAAAGHDGGLDTVCRYCPICSLGRLARTATPEVREHLTAAAMSLTFAVTSMLGDQQRSDRTTPVEKIDIAEDTDD